MAELKTSSLLPQMGLVVLKDWLLRLRTYNGMAILFKAAGTARRYAGLDRRYHRNCTNLENGDAI